jgi:hypothetical protein
VVKANQRREKGDKKPNLSQILGAWDRPIRAAIIPRFFQSLAKEKPGQCLGEEDNRRKSKSP